MLPKADENNGKIIKLESQIEHLKEQRDQIKEQIRELHNEPSMIDARLADRPCKVRQKQRGRTNKDGLISL
ncbi:hypothetical protein P7H19_17220 [Paenibacillus larvae]|nr:hypothetical protein [Paenibacillus larvae]MDT2237664.1 hypothetical protein [Paenibacillus larvae]